MSHDDDISIGKLVLWFVGIVVVATAFVMIFTGTIWGIQVGVSDVKGRGDAQIQINSATNRIQSQEWFEQVYGDIKAYNRQIQTQAKARDDYRTQNEGKSDPVGSIAQEQARLSQVVAGLKNQCASAVNDYNAEAHKVSKERFRSDDLPETLDAVRYCEEGAR